MSKPQSKKDDLDILFPDREVRIGEKTLRVRELRFAEQMTHNHLLMPVANAFTALASDLRMDDGMTHVLDLLSEHAEQVLPLVAVSCNPLGALPDQLEATQRWIAGLRSEEGEVLFMVWWAANQGFFVRRLLRPMQVAQERARAGRASSPTSLPLDTNTETLATTPSAS